MPIGWLSWRTRSCDPPPLHGGRRGKSKRRAAGKRARKARRA